MNSVYISGRTNSYGLRGLPDYAGYRGLATYSQSFHIDGGGVYSVTLPARFTSFAITDSNQQVVATGRTERTAQPVLARLSQGTYTALISTLVPDSQGHMDAVPLWQNGAPGQSPQRVLIPGKPAANGIPAVPDMYAILTPGRPVTLAIVPSLDAPVTPDGTVLQGTTEPAQGSDRTQQYFLSFLASGNFTFALSGPNLSFALQDQTGRVVAAGSNGATPRPDSLDTGTEIQAGPYTLSITAGSGEGQMPWSLAIRPGTTALQAQAPQPSSQSLESQQALQRHAQWQRLQGTLALQAKFDALAGKGGTKLLDLVA